MANVAAPLPNEPTSVPAQPPAQSPTTTPALSNVCWWRLFGQSGGAALFHVDLTTHAARESNALDWLDGEELSRWREFQYPGPRRRFALCRAALRALLCERLECDNDRLEFGAAEYEKPFAVLNGSPAPVGFNVSHSGEHGLIAIADRGRVGVDVEEFSSRPNLDGIIETVFGPEEQGELALVRGRRKLRLFFRLWTIKEALIKAVGMGLYMDMSGFEVPIAMRRGNPVSLFQFPDAPTVRWRLEYIGNGDFAAAVAHELDSDHSARPIS